MQPTSAKYIAKSIQDDRLATAARDRQLLSVGSDDPKTTRVGIRTAVATRIAALARRATHAAPAPQH